SPIDATELDKWTVLAQFPPTSFTFPPSSLIPKGYRLKRSDGSILINKTTRVTPTTLDITKWSIEDPGTGVIDTWIKNAGDDHAEGEKLFKADDRRMSVNGVGVRITYRGADIESCPALSVAELANWAYVGQEYTPIAYPGAVLAPKGFRYRRNETSQLLQLKANTLLPATYDASQWEAVSGANIRVLNGVNFDILTALSIVETEGVFNNVPQLANGPNNAAQYVSGYWRVVGDNNNGLIMLTISDGTNVDKLGGDWVLRVSTDAQNVRTVGTWRKITPGGAYKASANNLTVLTPDKIYWNLAHNLIVSFTGDGPITLFPIGDWSERTGTVTGLGGTTISGNFPLSGSDEIELHYEAAGLRFVIREASSSNRAPTAHNFGLTANVALKGLTHHMAEVHVEGGKDYTIAAADWQDGQWFRLVQTAAANTTERLLPSGFTGAFLRNSRSLDISAGVEIGGQGAQFLCTITRNGDNKFLNVFNRLIDNTSIETRLDVLSDLYHEADSPPNFDLPNWRFWHHLHREIRTVTSTLYYRAVGLNDATLLNQATYQITLTQDLATQVSPGNYQIDVDPGVNFAYTSNRTNVSNSLSFPAGVYGSVEWYYVNSVGDAMLAGRRVEVIGQATTAHGLGMQDAPSGAVGVRMILTRADGTSITYEYKLD
ncbi:MAG: hypothetical protein ACRC62_22965, partial [Microcoleus sp.]